MTTHRVASWGNPLPPESSEDALSADDMPTPIPVVQRIAEIRARIAQSGLVDLRDELLVILADLMLEVLGDEEEAGPPEAE